MMSEDSQQNATRNEDVPSSLAKEVHWLQHATFWSQIGLGIIGLIALWIYHGQLTAMQGQLDQMKTAAKSSSDQFAAQMGILNESLNQSRRQADASRDAADAAKDAAKEQVKALHTSERAYITVTNSDFDTLTNVFTLHLANTGHIPSGPVHFVVYWSTYVPTNIRATTPSSVPEGAHMSRVDLDAITPTSHQDLTVYFKEPQRDLLFNGTQQLQLAGTATYSDGFPDTPPAVYKFCLALRYQMDRKVSIVERCLPDVELPKLEKANQDNAQRQ